MSFSNQSDDILIEQLRYLPVIDLLSACEVNPSLVNLCNHQNLWRRRIQDEFPGINIAQIANPREYYLSLVLFGGQIYIHNGADVQQQSYDIIPYNDLIDRTKQIAESTGQSYVILYSRPVTNPQEIDIDVIAYQIEENIVFNTPGPNERITQVNIILNPDQDVLNSLVYYSFIQQLPEIGPNQEVRFTYNGRDIVWTIRDIRHVISSGKTVVRRLKNLILDNHKLNNTPFYQMLINRALTHQQTYIKNSKIPSLMDNIITENLEERKQSLLNMIVQAMPQSKFDPNMSNRGLFLGFSSYQDFLNFQQNYIIELHEGQIQSIEFFSNQLLPISKLYVDEIDTFFDQISIVFDSEGSIVMV